MAERTGRTKSFYVREAVIVNNAIEVRVVEVRGKTVRLGFRFPPDATVLR